MPSVLAAALASKLPDVIACIVSLFLIVAGRYFCFAGGAYWLCYRRFRDRLAPRKLDSAFPPRAIVRAEIAHSVRSSIVFALGGAAIYFAWEAGLSRIYLAPDEYGWWYPPVSLIVLMLLHETYFYWTHRLMHLPGIFAAVHRVHHESKNPTPFAAFSFHPLEAVIEAVIFPLLVLLVPVHVGVLLAFLMLMTVLSVFNHLGYELYPAGMARGPLGKYLITATHHFLHHRRVRGNYGLYFTFWDRWMGTEHPDYPEIYDRARPQAGRSVGSPLSGAASAALSDDFS